MSLINARKTALFTGPQGPQGPPGPPGPAGSAGGLAPNSVNGTGFWFSQGGSLQQANGITLTGDVLQGALTGTTVPLTVQGIQGKAIPAMSGVNTTLIWSGTAFSWGSAGALSAFGADLAGSTATNQWVASISGPGASGTSVPINTVGFTVQATVAFNFQQASAAFHNANANNLTFTGQFNTDATSTTGKSGDIIFNLGPPPNTSTTEAFVRFQRNGTDIVWFGTDPGAPGDQGIWLGSTTPTASNWSLLANTSQLYLSTQPVGAAFMFLIANSASVQLSNGDLAFESGGAIGQPNTLLGSTTYPWVQVWGNQFLFTPGNTSPAIVQGQLAGTGTTPGQIMVIRAQPGQAQTGAVANTNGGIIDLITGSPGTGGSGAAGKYGYVSVNSGPVSGGLSGGGFTAIVMGDYAAAAGAGQGVYGAIWFATGAPNTQNFGFLGNQSFTYLNVPLGGTISLSFNGAGATGIDMVAASISMVPATLRWYNGIAAPLLTQVTQANGGAAPQNLTISPQFQFGTDQGSQALNTPGACIVNLGAPFTTTHAGNETTLTVQRNGVSTVSIGPYPGTPTIGAIWLSSSFAAVNPVAANFALAGDSGNTYLNGPTNIAFRCGNVNQIQLSANSLTISTAIVTTYTIAWGGAASASGNPIAIIGQAAGGSGNVGGGVALVGGNGGAGASTGGGVVLYTGNGNGGLGEGTIQFGWGSNGGAAPPTGNTATWSISTTQLLFKQDPGVANIVPINMVFTPQGINAGSTTTAANTPGSFVVNVAAIGVNTNLGNHGGLYVQDNSVNQCVIGIGGIASGGPSGSTIWLGAAGGGITPGATNYAIFSDASSVRINGVTTSVIFQVAGTSYAGVSSAALSPASDLGITLGALGTRWSALYVQNTSITSGGLGGNSTQSTPLNLTVASLITLTAGTQNLTAAQIASPYLQFTGAAQTGSPGTTLNLNAAIGNGITGTIRILDFSAVTGLGTNTVKVQVGTGTKTLTVSAAVVYLIVITGANTLDFQLLS